MIGRTLNTLFEPRVGRWLLAALLVFLIAMPWLLGEAGQYYTVLLMTVFIFAVLGHSWNLLAGFCGLLSFGTQLYVGLSGFTVAILSYYFGASVWFGMLMGGVVAALFAWLLAAPVSDRKGQRSTWIGIAVGVALWVIYEIVIAQVPAADVFGGAYIRRVIILFGLFLYALPLLKLEGAYFAVATWLIAAAVASIFNEWRVVGAGGGMTIASDTTITQRYYAALILVVLATAVVWWLLKSRYGLALTAVRDDNEAASSIGIDIRRVKTMVFVISAPMAAMAAGLYYIDQVTITPPDAFHIRWSAYVVFIVVAGGMGTLEGPLIGAVLFVIVQRILVGVWGGGELTLGIAAVALILILPRGIAGFIADRRNAARVAQPGDGDAPGAGADIEAAPAPPAARQKRTGPGGVAAALLLPASPLPYLKPEAKPWAALARASRAASGRIGAASPDAIVLMVNGWTTASGVPLMAQSRLKGARTDDTFHAFGPIDYDLRIDRDLARAIAGSSAGRNAAAHLVDDTHYAVDMGIILAAKWLAAGSTPFVVIGRPATADAAPLGAAVAAAARAAGKRIAVVGVGALSVPPTAPEANAAHDAIDTAASDTFNRRVLGLMEAGRTGALASLAPDAGVRVDGDGAHIAFLAGAVEGRALGADILAYGATMGAGAAVAAFRLAPGNGDKA
ncbi:hypothetical protein RDV64_05370 [Acuticoccus sp. MNP-M23]|uniref:ABC transporter permease subunit n=1 Tax=Acuticoccus sp. MNP-M23 TaxID=3072793 RepID=UPI002814A027|nr:hypothetical protein [Acuticoccus sp. MNP-M23]WMS43828.1 hypothetical protein RDV64_05370 [Acuticoccus sp. MNP-M23]